MLRIRWIIGCGILFLIPCAVQATIRHVPSGYSTVQAAIVSSTDGDTVLVDHGTYVENIDFLGKRIVVVSLLAVTGDTSHIALTVLDGGGSGVNKSVVTFQGSEDSTSVLRGFRITNGYASGSHGGGVTISNGSNPRLEDCQIVNNTGASGPMNGIGIYCTGSSPTISRCLVANNSAPANGNYDHNGGGVCVTLSSAPVISNCSIVNNSIAASVYYRNNGGGVYCYGASPIFRNCTIADNSADFGGGICVVSANVQVHSCSFSENTVRGNAAAHWAR